MNLTQNTPEWLSFRKNRVGASDAPIIMGVSPWKTPLQLWEEKLDITPSPEMSYAMQRGQDLEDEARKLFESQLGIYVFPTVVQHPKHEWMIASMDGLDINGEIAVEIKCANKQDHSETILGKIPDKYYPQVQHQMAVCGIDAMFYFSYDGVDGVVLEVFRDDKYINNLIEKEWEFYQCIQEFTPPPLSEKDYQIKSDDLWMELSEQWKNANALLKEYTAKEKGLREHLISMAQDTNCKGNGVLLNKIIRKGMVDYASIPELKNVNVENYRKDKITSWRISCGK
jgi:putative phage-type endonuclease